MTESLQTDQVKFREACEALARCDDVTQIPALLDEVRRLRYENAMAVTMGSLEIFSQVFAKRNLASQGARILAVFMELLNEKNPQLMKGSEKIHSIQAHLASVQEGNGIGAASKTRDYAGYNLGILDRLPIQQLASTQSIGPVLEHKPASTQSVESPEYLAAFKVATRNVRIRCDDLSKIDRLITNLDTAIELANTYAEKHQGKNERDDEQFRKEAILAIRCITRRCFTHRDHGLNASIRDKAGDQLIAAFAVLLPIATRNRSQWERETAQGGADLPFTAMAERRGIAGGRWGFIEYMNGLPLDKRIQSLQALESFAAGALEEKKREKARAAEPDTSDDNAAPEKRINRRSEGTKRKGR